VASYLTHHGYVDTAESFLNQLREERIERATGLNGVSTTATTATTTSASSSSSSALASEPTTTNSSALRAEIRAAALSGTASGAQRALDLVEQHFPSLLDPSPSPPATSSKGEGALTAAEEGKSIGFRLRCRVFVEAVLEWSRANRDPAGMAQLAMEAADASAAPPSTAAGTAGHGDVVVDEDADMLSASTVLDGAPAATTSSSFPPSSSAAPSLTLDSILLLGQSLHATYSSDPDPRVREELQAVLGLMAYRDPEKEATGRTRELLSKGERENVADELNKAILRESSGAFSPSFHPPPPLSCTASAAYLRFVELFAPREKQVLTICFGTAPLPGAAGLPPVPALEALFRQAAASIRLAGDLGSGSAAMIDVKSMFSASPKAVAAASFRQASPL
jgi:hypothetical protein